MAEPAARQPSDPQQESGPGYAENPDYRIDLEPCPKRVRVLFAGETVADSRRVVFLRETRHTGVYYFPLEDLRQDLLQPSDHETYCPYKGTAAYWSVVAGDRRAENAVWGYDAPYLEVADMKGYRAFYWDRMDRWLEEEEEVFVHPRDPKVRLDILDSAREVTVRLGGEVVARSRRCRFLFETGHATRYYFPEADVRLDLLSPSARVTACPYKGRARYWNADIGGESFADVAWSYEHPLRESERIRDRICFYPERVEAITVEGEP